MVQQGRMNEAPSQAGSHLQKARTHAEQAKRAAPIRWLDIELSRGPNCQGNSSHCQAVAKRNNKNTNLFFSLLKSLYKLEYSNHGSYVTASRV